MSRNGETEFVVEQTALAWLAATRDALLPKLLSGEVRVPEAEKIARNFLIR